MQTRYFALIFGIVYGLSGVLGFFLGDERTTPDLVVEGSYRNLLFLFPVNVLHNLYHIAVGALGILAYRSYDAARTYSRVFAVVFALLTVMGFVRAADLYTTFGLIPLFSHNILLHALTALATGYFGFIAPPATDVDAAASRAR